MLYSFAFKLHLFFRSGIEAALSGSTGAGKRDCGNGTLHAGVRFLSQTARRSEGGEEKTKNSPGINFNFFEAVRSNH